MAGMSNASSLLYLTMDNINWAGFYLIGWGMVFTLQESHMCPYTNGKGYGTAKDQGDTDRRCK